MDAGWLTKRAPDAGDSAAISSSFLRLSLFLAGRLRRPRPSAGNAIRWAALAQQGELQMEYMQMKYYPKEVYYENRGGVNYIILDYGDNKVEHVIAAQQSVHLTLLESEQIWSSYCSCATCKQRSAVIPQSR
jgi:hypothetical protein